MMRLVEFVLVLSVGFGLGYVGERVVKAVHQQDPCWRLEDVCARGQSSMNIRTMAVCTYSWPLIQKGNSEQCAEVLRHLSTK